ncbi:succinyldiaminopimelate desuccinylase [Hasllibacter halocynthiae]|uniref:Succinyl-diaminopimelate desuccinylase n=1 Tax=Hasllibacter halocynthiae TaxID=595589 RepID=A0A2T0X1W6_9RHOB|nr:succinyl-diaminopimelate desuccinylase [Hasllibacter halocynthiae]PRY92854.1 succinyldiaminopimelate desuccinylase [Hasllibacter halocynthiae]
MTDPADLTARLVRCPSVTPEEGGALRLLAEELAAAGFHCERIDRGGVSNLLARAGAKGAPRTFGFNGHTDVVPTGPEGEWTHPPFSGAEADGLIWGRGSVDMKSGVAAFAAAAMRVAKDLPEGGAILLAITGDEEGEAVDGTRALLDGMAARGEAMTVCLVGEPTSPDSFGQAMKIGRRGSMNALFTATGVQGHSAYPHRNRNPVPALAKLVDRLSTHRLDEGTEHFDPSNLEVTGFDTGNPATNVVPGACRAMVNLRFNDRHTGASLTEWLRKEAAAVAEETGIAIDLSASISGEAFLTPPGPLSDLVADAVEAETGRRPELSTSGGTSDARFVKDHCPVVEFGLVGRGMHEVDERVPVEDVRRLSAIYERILRAFFA